MYWDDQAACEDTDESGRWYTGTIRDYSESLQEHYVVFDDKQTKWFTVRLELELGTWKWLDTPPKACVEDKLFDARAHYIEYNSGTRLLNMYPNVALLSQENVDNPKAS